MSKINVKKVLKGMEFEKMFARPGDVQRIEAILKHVINWGVKDFIMIPTGKGGLVDYCLEKSQLHELDLKVYDLFFSADRFNKHLDSFYSGKDKLLELNKELKEGLNKKEILQIYKRYVDVLVGDFSTVFIIPWGLDSYVVPKIKELLAKDLGKEDIEDEWSAVNSPTELIEIQKLQILISELFLQDRLEEELPEITKKYGWVTVYGMDDKPAEKDYFRTLILGSKDEIESKIREMKENIEGNKDTFNKLLEKIKDQKLKNAVKALNFYIAFRTDSYPSTAFSIIF